MEFSAAWCLSIHGQAARATYIRRSSSSSKTEFVGDGKRPKKANLYAANGIFVNFSRGNVFLRQLEMLWIMKHTLLGKFA